VAIAEDDGLPQTVSEGTAGTMGATNTTAKITRAAHFASDVKDCQCEHQSVFQVSSIIGIPPVKILIIEQNSDDDW